MIKHRTVCPNFYVVEVSGNSLYFSYDTLVGFTVKGESYVSENVWSKTTEKHLNLFSIKESRIPYAEFEKQAQKLLW